MGSLLSKAQKEEEDRQQDYNQWRPNAAGALGVGGYDDDYGGAGAQDAADWSRYRGLAYEYPAAPIQANTRVTFTAAEVKLNMGKVVYCSGPHRNAESQKAFTKASHKEDRRPSEIEIPIHYYDQGNYRAFKSKKIKRWTPFKFNKRRNFANGPGAPEADVITLVDAKRERDYMEISWHEFIGNFSPFNEEQSQRGQKGSYFDTASWTVEKENKKPSIDKTPAPAPPPRQEFYGGGGGEGGGDGGYHHGHSSHRSHY